MRRLKTLASALTVALVVIAAVDYTASAATGKPFVLGKINKANKQTTLKRTSAGPALRLSTTSSSAAPFTTNARGKVGNLNADLLDGVDSAALRTRSYVWRQSVTNLSSVQYELPLPAGSYLVSYSVSFWGLPDDNEVECWVDEQGSAADRYTAYSSVRHPAVGGLIYYPALSGSGLVTKSATTTIVVGCNATAPFDTEAELPIEIVATPTTVVLSSSLTSQ